MAKVIYFIITFVVVADLYADEYQKKVTEKLIKNPDDLETIVKAGAYYYKRKDYKKAIYYFSAPNLVSHKNYIKIKYFQAKSHFFLKDYKNAYYVFRYILEINPIFSKRQEIRSYLKKISKFYKPTELDIYGQVSLYYGSLDYEDDAIKDSGNFMGAYGLIGKRHYLGEFGVENVDLNLKNEEISFSYNQLDMTLGASYFNDDFTSKYSIFYHQNNTDSNSNTAFSVKCFGLAYNYYWLDKTNVGFELSSMSLYDNSLYDDISAIQISSYLLYPLTNLFKFETKYNYSKNNHAVQDNNNSFSYEFGIIAMLADRFTIGASYIGGKELFLQKNRGFLVQNSTDLISKVVKLIATIGISDNFSVNITRVMFDYTEEGNNEKFNSSSNIIFGNYLF